MKSARATNREIAVAVLVGVIGGAMIPFGDEIEQHASSNEDRRSSDSLGQDDSTQTRQRLQQSDQR